MRRRSLLKLAAGSAAMRAAPAMAQSWPQRPLWLVVASGPGSSLDALARAIADRLKQRLGQPVLIDNRSAAGGTVAMELVAKSTDHHTIGLGFNGPLAFAPFLYSRLPYDPFKDLAPIVMTSSQPNLLAVNARFPVKTVADLIDYAKARPGQLNYASVGNASSSHLSMELFKALTGTFIVHIPFNGAPPAALSVAAGEAQMLMAVTTAIAPYLPSGKLRLLATTGSGRFALMPDVPTVAETGGPLKTFESLAWNGVVGPASMPHEVILRLNGEINEALHDPEAAKRIAAAGLQTVGGTPQAMRDYLAAEARRWKPIIDRTGAHLE